jgi:hypothetical protein
MTKAYKFLAHGARGRFSEFEWPRPSDGPGAWVDAGPVIADCAQGVHACRASDLPGWIDDELWVVELDGQLVERESMLIAQRGRLLHRVEAWGAEAQRAFAEACVWRVRDAAVAHLRSSGSFDAADALASATDLRALQERAGEVLEATGDDAAAFAADAVSLLKGDRPDTPSTEGNRGDALPPSATAANLGFAAAHGIAQIGASSYERAFAAEREWQAAWLAERLRLVGS